MARALLVRASMDAVKMLVVTCCVLAGSCTKHVAAEHARAATEEVIDRAANPTVRVPPESRSFVQVADVRAVDDWPVLRAPGRIAFREGALGRVGAPVMARVATIHVTLGQTVRRGDPLITVESPEALAMRATARTSAEVERAAREELARVQRLAAEGVANQREILEAQLRETSTQIDATRAQSTVAFIGSGGGRNVVLRAPLDGVVLSLDATVGAIVGNDDRSLVEVGDPSQIWVDCQVFQSDLGSVEVGQQARVQLGRAATVNGRVVAVGAEVRESRTAVVRVALDEVSSAIRPGEYARVSVLSRAPVVVVPSTSVVVRDGRQYAVFVEVGHESFELQRRIVNVGTSFDGRVSITSGLTVGDRIVTSGTLLLDGAADQLL